MEPEPDWRRQEEPWRLWTGQEGGRSKSWWSAGISLKCLYRVWTWWCREQEVELAAQQAAVMQTTRKLHSEVAELKVGEGTGAGGYYVTGGSRRDETGYGGSRGKSKNRNAELR